MDELCVKTRSQDNRKWSMTPRSSVHDTGTNTCICTYSCQINISKHFSFRGRMLHAYAPSDIALPFSGEAAMGQGRTFSDSFSFFVLRDASRQSPWSFSGLPLPRHRCGVGFRRWHFALHTAFQHTSPYVSTDRNRQRNADPEKPSSKWNFAAHVEGSN
jgi:hypothetical protein